MVNVIESRNVPIKGVVASLLDVERLSSVVFDCYKEANGEDDRARIKFTATCFDKSHFSSGDVEFFFQQINYCYKTNFRSIHFLFYP